MIEVTFGETTHKVIGKPITFLCKASTVNDKLTVKEAFPISIEETLYHMERVQVLHKSAYYWYERIQGTDKEVLELIPQINGLTPKEIERFNSWGLKVTLKSSDDIRKLDIGARHLMGLIDLVLKLTDKGINRFHIVNPETGLHQAIQGNLTDFFYSFKKQHTE